MTKAQFASVCGVSRAAVGQEAKRFHVIVESGQVDIKNPLNLAYFQKALVRMTRKGTGELPPGWVVLVAFREGGKGVPLIWFPPGVDEYFGGEPVGTGEKIESDGGWHIDIPAGKAISPERVEHRLSVVPARGVVPAWLKDAWGDEKGVGKKT